MRVLVDTNVVLDVVLQRPVHKHEASLVWDRCERSDVDGLVASISHTTIAYLIQKAFGHRQVADDLAEILRVFRVASVGSAEIRTALVDVQSGHFLDFEDAVQHAAAETAGAEAIVTRNVRDFAGARLAVYTPGDLVARL